MTKINIHNVTDITVSHKERNGARWTEIVVVDQSGHETEIVLFPAINSDLPVDEDLSQVRELGPQTRVAQ